MARLRQAKTQALLLISNLKKFIYDQMDVQTI